MTDTPETPQNPAEGDVAGETKEERTRRMNFFADAARAGLHATGCDIMEQLEAAAVPDASSCMLMGACQFVAQSYEGIAAEYGLNKADMKKHMIDAVSIYFDTYCEMRIKDLASTEPGEV